MIKVGLTGGIGSGKTTVAKVFETLGIPVFYADTEAKWLMNRSAEIRQKLNAYFGEELYPDQELNRARLAELIFHNSEAMAHVNSIVHPAVIQASEEWSEKQKSPYVIHEAAILFETNGYKRFDKTILVVAPESIRIARVMERDNVTKEAVLARMKNQWPDEKKETLADFLILNDGKEMLLPQIMRIHENIIRSANS